MKKKILLISLLAALILFSIVPAARFISSKPLLAGDTPYYHLRIAESIKEEGIPEFDPLVDRPYQPNLYHLLLALQPALLSLILPILSGLFSVIIFYLILDKLNISQLNRSSIMITLVLSPLFISVFTFSNEFSLILLLILLGFYCFIKGKHNFIFALAISALMPFFGTLPLLILLSSFLIYSLNYQKNFKYFYIILGSSALVYSAYQIPFLLTYGFPHKTSLISSNILANLISDLGAKYGFGIFNIILASVGFYRLWRIKKQITAYSLLALLVIFAFYAPTAYIYLTFISAIFAGFGLSSIIKMRWKIDLIKTLTIILIICGLFFSTLSYINRTANSLPDKDVIKSMEWIKENTPSNSVILSHYSKGNWITAIADRKVVLDSQADYIKNIKERSLDVNTTFYSRNLVTTEKLLSKYNVHYLWIDSKMRSGQVWSKEQEGILFLFRNSEKFKKVYSKDSIEVWEYLG